MGLKRPALISGRRTPAAPLSWDDYASRWSSLHGGLDPRDARTTVRMWQRLAFSIARPLARRRVRPNAVTTVGLLSSIGVPLAVLPGGPWLFLAAGLVLVAALADSADGGVAVLSGRATGLGAFYGSMADRVSEAVWLVALWLVGAPGYLAAACGGLAWLHEYARSRAALSGMPGVGAVTVADRPTRVLAVFTALLLGGLAWAFGAASLAPRLAAGAATVAVGVWLILGLVGGSRLLSVVRQALQDV